LRARHVLFALSQAEPDKQVFALVHPERRDEAREALAQPELSRAKVELIEGDPVAIDFGLSGPSYMELSRAVEVVHALYSITDASVGEQVAEQVNVGAARELAEFSRVASGLRSLILYSSVFVSGQRTGLVREGELEAGQAFRSPVERTLAVAERLLRRSGAPCTVLRSGHLLGEGERFALEAMSAPYLLMILLASAPSEVALPLLPSADTPVALTPLDYLARFGVFAARALAPGSTFHVLDPAQWPLRGFLGLVAERSGRKLAGGFNPTALTRALVGNPAARLLPQNVRSIFEVLTSSAEYATDNVAELVARGAPVCPSLESYLDRLLDHIRERIEHGNPAPGRRHQAPFLVA
jgi:nucleoside-diphosphate-sugar epimerase